MSNLLCKIANSIWVSLCLSKSKSFRKAVNDVTKEQEKILNSLLEDNADTVYGKKYGFPDIKTIKDFQEKVPLTAYSDYSPYIDRISCGEKNILTSEPVIMLELSSGSTCASKLIPYTGKLKKEFQSGISPWIYNMYRNIKGLGSGKAYWSITPVIREKKRTASGIPIGFEEDSQYFGFIEQFLLNRIFAVPNEVKEIQDIDVFRYVTLLFLLKERNLTFISVWNPTFLTLLLKEFEKWKSLLIEDLANDTITPPGPLPKELKDVLVKKLGGNRKRVRELKDIIIEFNNTYLVNGKTVFEYIWPNLKLISCWTDANAAFYVPLIGELFPDIAIQGKGLIATEGFVSFPLWGREGAALAVCSHFFEFIEYDTGRQELSDKSIKLAHELEAGKVYSVVLTTGGGFYRYKLQDLITVTGFEKNCPLIKFLGKEDKVSDYFGEKLNEYYVAETLKKVFSKYPIDKEFYMVAPEIDISGQSGFYALYLELSDSDNIDNELLKKFAKELDNELMNNFHYKYCRELKQLSALKIFIIKSGYGIRKNGVQEYLNESLNSGQRYGNIKPVVLSAKTGWSEKFSGGFI